MHVLQTGLLNGYFWALADYMYKMLHKLVQSRQRHNRKITQRVHGNGFLFSNSMRKNFVICNKAASLHWNQRIETEMYVWTFPKSCFCNSESSFDLTVEVQKITLHLNVACHKTSNSPPAPPFCWKWIRCFDNWLTPPPPAPLSICKYWQGRPCWASTPHGGGLT